LAVSKRSAPASNIKLHALETEGLANRYGRRGEVVLVRVVIKYRANNAYELFVSHVVRLVR
jgi:hypothetical protein